MDTSINLYKEETISGIDHKTNLYMYLEFDDSCMIDFGLGGKLGYEQLAIIGPDHHVSVLYLNKTEMRLLRDTISAALDLMK